MADILKLFSLSVRDGQMIAAGAAVFFIFWRFFDAVVFKPFWMLTEEREALTSGATETSKALNEEALSIAKRCQDQIQSARIQAMTEKFQALSQAKKDAAKITGDAESAVQELLKKARAERENNRAAARRTCRRFSGSPSASRPEGPPPGC